MSDNLLFPPSRIECVSTTGASPVLGWEIGELFEGTYLPPASIASGPDQAFADFSVDGLPSSNFGIFTCEDGTGKISHFFDDGWANTQSLYYNDVDSNGSNNYYFLLSTYM